MFSFFYLKERFEKEFFLEVFFLLNLDEKCSVFAFLFTFFRSNFGCLLPTATSSSSSGISFGKRCLPVSDAS